MRLYLLYAIVPAVLSYLYTQPGRYRVRFTLLPSGLYHRHVLTDEVHAYLVAPGDPLDAGKKRLAPLRRELRAIFRKHGAGIKRPA